MADSTSSDEIIEMWQDRIETREIGKIGVLEAQFLLLLEIRDLMEDIKENTTPA